MSSRVICTIIEACAGLTCCAIDCWHRAKHEGEKLDLKQQLAWQSQQMEAMSARITELENK